MYGGGCFENSGIIPLGWQYVVGDAPTNTIFPFRSYWLMPIVNKRIFKNITGEQLSYIPIYISSGANSPLSFIPLPFHGFISLVQNNAILGFLMKTNTLSASVFKQFASKITELKEIIRLNTTSDTIPDKYIPEYISICRQIMEEEEDKRRLMTEQISDNDMYQIKSKLGSIEYFNEIIDTSNGAINPNYRYILAKHNEIRKIGEQLLDPHTIENDGIKYIEPSPAKDNLIIQVSGELDNRMGGDFGDGCILPLIHDLKNINDLIVQTNSCIFKEFPIVSDKIRGFYSYLKQFSEIPDFNMIPKNYPQLLNSLYPFSTQKYTPEDYKKIMYNISILNEYVPQVKKDQIFNSVRFDDILNYIYKLIQQ